MIRRPRRPFRLTPGMLLLIALDAAGLLLFSAALLFLVHRISFLQGHPASQTEAIVMLVVGVAAMLGAAMGILRHIARQAVLREQQEQQTPPG
ncbi:MAG: DUF1418 family protein [Rhodocyclaceae bacterium]|nr:DUF1418 family protein [Rhodocyclaceae bacterium]